MLPAPPAPALSAPAVHPHWRRIALPGMVALLCLTATACGAPSATAPAAPVPAAVATFLVTTDGSAAALTLPPDAAQVVLRLAGDLGNPDELTAETATADRPEATRRWPVDAVPVPADGAAASVTVPAYALPPGDHSVTVWRGDAEVVRRYAFRVTAHTVAAP